MVTACFISASKELAACYAHMCAITAEMGSVDFQLPFKEFRRKDGGSETHSLVGGTSVSVSSNNAIEASINHSKKPQKKKMSLDEYKKRKETTHVNTDGK